ncbi:conserved hypothetical protein [Talaromyces stipitatus ATCC 10500]|uniref:Xylanolytic transcriptional activator regulatory domain-containing protein n=1 Tax=Talaromyces stipitatus (strain ATCC 10500 / CBS 375.48 / QM 6759 / NRRL 1006) TaxID=441959 RepID=B8MAZ2_TALSN|nr:uncharacterized protein TSTA_124210 [Talaromyces stipitatus ATCC 10500]EED18693.1 conserved hypothetical protein [Talaromyces stipitatus ATCC 10500]
MPSHKLGSSVAELYDLVSSVDGQSPDVPVLLRAKDLEHSSPETSFQHKSSRTIPTWLVIRNLPPIDRIRELIDIYFSHLHSVRCMGFLHIPNFMEQFQNSKTVYSEFSGLVYIMCALAAPIYYAKTIGYPEEEPSSDTRFYNAGKGWAEAAMQCVFATFGNPTIECLMTEILLHEYYLRVGDYSKAFLISGSISRRVQLLQLNVEHDNDILCQKNEISWAAKESRRRLLWACYLLDASIECGIDQLRFISAGDLQVQLPCTEDSFIRNMPCITEMLSVGKLLPFVERQALATFTVENIDMRGHYIRAMAIRSKILKHVKHLDGEIPWEANGNSQFHALNEELRDIENSIPESMRMSTENVYIYKTSGRLNLFFGLHILISQTYNDLYRVGVSKLVFPNSATKWIRENAPEEFINMCHHTCLEKAIYIGSLLQDLWERHKLSIIDTPYAVHTQICSSVLVTSLESWRVLDPSMFSKFSYQDCHEILQSNVRILSFLAKYIKVDLYYESAVQALRRFDSLFSGEARGGFSAISVETPSVVDRNMEPKNPAQFSLEYILNPLGTYPMARKQVYERHQSESTQDRQSEISTPEIQQLMPHQRPFLSRITDDLSLSNNRFYSSNAVYSLPSPEEGLLPLPDWASGISIMGGMGYPNFLEEFL